MGHQIVITAILSASLYAGASNASELVLSFSGQNIPSFNGLSNVSDQGISAAIPEPETYAMMLAGIGLLGFIAHRRKNDSLNMSMAV